MNKQRMTPAYLLLFIWIISLGGWRISQAQAYSNEVKNKLIGFASYFDFLNIPRVNQKNDKDLTASEVQRIRLPYYRNKVLLIDQNGDGAVTYVEARPQATTLLRMGLKSTRAHIEKTFDPDRDSVVPFREAMQVAKTDAVRQFIKLFDEDHNQTLAGKECTLFYDCLYYLYLQSWAAERLNLIEHVSGSESKRLIWQRKFLIMVLDRDTNGVVTQTEVQTFLKNLDPVPRTKELRKLQSLAKQLKADLSLETGTINRQTLPDSKPKLTKTVKRTPLPTTNPPAPKPAPIISRTGNPKKKSALNREKLLKELLLEESFSENLW